eukprot:357049-Chlamydomonas_euryale.AAC.2
MASPPPEMWAGQPPFWTSLPRQQTAPAPRADPAAGLLLPACRGDSRTKVRIVLRQKSSFTDDRDPTHAVVIGTKG